MDLARLKKLGDKNLKKNKIGNVKLPPIDTSEVKTILDIDPEFYTLVEGRPIRPNTSLNTYKQNIKGIALKRILRGYLIDEIIRIDKEIEMEKKIYETTNKHFEECQRSFDKFLAFDNDKTISIMRKSDNLAKELVNHTEEQKIIRFELSSIKSKLQYTEETSLILFSLEKFLHNAAPHTWAQKEQVNIEKTMTEIVPLESDIFKSVDVDLIEERLNKLPPPKLYFETPQQLIDAFALLEDQNLNYLLATEELTVKKNTFLERKEKLKIVLDQELKYMEKKIKEVEELINRQVSRETEIKDSFFKILKDKMEYLIASDTALKLNTCVEFTYEKLIAPNETKLSISDMVTAMETEYDNLQIQLSTFDLDLVKAIEKEVWDQGIQEIKKAKEASKLLKNVDKLSKRLKASYEPSKKPVTN